MRKDTVPSYAALSNRRHSQSGRSLVGQIILRNSSLRGQRSLQLCMRMAAKTSLERISSSATSCLLAFPNKASSLEESLEERPVILA
jgi:hypothetical protein